MRVVTVCIMAAVLVGCHRRQPKMSDRQLQQLRADVPGITDDCLDKVKWGGIQAIPDDVDKCFKMMPAIRWRGLWRDQFEDQLFCPAPAAQCPTPSQTERIDIDIKSRPAGVERDPLGAVYAVDFIGRGTAEGTPMKAYGYQQEIIVDRWISIRQVEAPPPPPTKAEIVKYWKSCEAAKTCKPNWNEINKMKN